MNASLTRHAQRASSLMGRLINVESVTLGKGIIDKQAAAIKSVKRNNITVSRNKSALIQYHSVHLDLSMIVRNYAVGVEKETILSTIKVHKNAKKAANME
jgi:hypothetical protein